MNAQRTIPHYKILFLSHNSDPQDIKICTHVFVMCCFVFWPYHEIYYPYCSELLHWHVATKKTERNRNVCISTFGWCGQQFSVVVKFQHSGTHPILQNRYKVFAMIQSSSHSQIASKQTGAGTQICMFFIKPYLSVSRCSLSKQTGQITCVSVYQGWMLVAS